MAVLEIYAIRSRMDDRIKYALNPEKTSCMGFPNLNGLPDTLTDAVNCFCDNAYEQMLRTKSYFGKEDQVLGYHFIQSFKPGETTPQQAHEIGLQFAERCFGERFEAVIGTHTDKSHLHNHIVINSVSFEDGRKYRSTPKTFYELRSISDEICKEYGLSVIKKPSVKAGKHYAEWKAEKEGRPTMRGMIREDIDVILAQARTIDEFWDMLRGRGYEIRINERRKYVTVRHPNGERFIRLKSLGDEYTPRQLAARIAAQRGNVVQNIRQIQMQQQNRGKRKKYYPMPHTAAPQKHKKLHGFRALYWRYLYMLGKVKKRQAPRRVRGEMLEELKKLDRYAKQYYFLRDNRLQTGKDVTMFKDSLANEIDVLTDRRARLYADLHKPESYKEAVCTETKKITAELRGLRREQRICDAIQSAAPEISARLDAASAEQKRVKLKRMGGDQYEHGKHSGRSGIENGTDADRNRSPSRGQRGNEHRSPARGSTPQRETGFGKDLY